MIRNTHTTEILYLLSDYYVSEVALEIAVGVGV